MTDMVAWMSILSVFITAFFAYLVARLNVVQQRKLVATDVGTKEIGWRDDYIEYSSRPALSDLWWAENKNQHKCTDCGLSDKACLELTSIYVFGEIIGHRCVWCEELKSLTIHLETHGSRNKTDLNYLRHQ